MTWEKIREKIIMTFHSTEYCHHLGERMWENFSQNFASLLIVSFCVPLYHNEPILIIRKALLAFRKRYLTVYPYPYAVFEPSC